MTDQSYQGRGFGARGIGFGARPAIIVVDFQLGFTDPSMTLGGSPLVLAARDATARLLEQARPLGVPVVQAYVASCGADDALHWKIPAVLTDFHDGMPATRIDPLVLDSAHDVIVRKNAPSALFQTPAISYLVRRNVDTVIVTGCNTSGCVRATIIDAFSYGFRVVVPEDCCGDVDRGPHDDNLRDVGRRYADVVDSATVVAAMKALKNPRST